MIPQSIITEWRERAPWPSDAQVEQDLVISRCLVELFSDPTLNRDLAFRGGTALYKLFVNPPVRYSEDIDLVRTSDLPPVEIAKAIRSKLDPVFEQPPTIKQDSFTYDLSYGFNAEDAASTPLGLKIEINKRDIGAYFEYETKTLAINNGYYAGTASIRTYSIEELLSTKLIALYRRSRSRDLFDLWYACKELTVDLPRTVEAFGYYNENAHLTITRIEFSRRFEEKILDKAFRSDVDNYLRPGTEWDLESAAAFVKTNVIPLLE